MLIRIVSDMAQIHNRVIVHWGNTSQFNIHADSPFALVQFVRSLVHENSGRRGCGEMQRVGHGRGDQLVSKEHSTFV